MYLYAGLLKITKKIPYQTKPTPNSAVMDPQSNSRLSSTAKRRPLVALDAHLGMSCPQESDCLAELKLQS